MSLKVSWSSLVRGRVVLCLASCMALAVMLAGCGSREHQQEERARRARQMRDVSRMLDAMEATTTTSVPDGIYTPVPVVPPSSPMVAADQQRSSSALLATLAIAIAGGLTASMLVTFAWRRRKRLFASRPQTSLEPVMELDPPPSLDADRERATPPPAWIYRGSPFETPLIHVADEPVNLLVPPAIATSPVPTAGWEDCVRQARGLPRQDADARLANAEREVLAALHEADRATRPSLLACWMRIRLARAERLSGATRLFALRELMASIGSDPAAIEPAVIDARIEAQLAWASWVRGDAAASRLAEAERLCSLLDGAGSPVAALALRRKGQVFLRRAELARGAAALSELDRAQTCFDQAHALSPDAETALLAARSALQRARSLPPKDAADACAHALVHAFLAEQEPACRAEALACRLDIQLVYAALGVDEHSHTGVTASLGRDLEAAGPLAPAARLALARACQSEGDHAKAAHLCESIWNDDGAHAGLLDLWRDACRHWADMEGHDRPALARSLRHLAIASTTL